MCCKRLILTLMSELPTILVTRATVRAPSAFRVTALSSSNWNTVHFEEFPAFLRLQQSATDSPPFASSSYVFAKNFCLTANSPGRV